MVRLVVGRGSDVREEALIHLIAILKKYYLKVKAQSLKDKAKYILSMFMTKNTVSMISFNGAQIW